MIALSRKRMLIDRVNANGCELGRTARWMVCDECVIRGAGVDVGAGCICMAMGAHLTALWSAGGVSKRLAFCVFLVRLCIILARQPHASLSRDHARQD